MLLPAISLSAVSIGGGELRSIGGIELRRLCIWISSTFVTAVLSRVERLRRCLVTLVWVALFWRAAFVSFPTSMVEEGLCTSVELAAAAMFSSSVSSCDLTKLSRFIFPPCMAFLKRLAVTVLYYLSRYCLTFEAAVEEG